MSSASSTSLRSGGRVRRWWSAFLAWPYAFIVVLSIAVGILTIVLADDLGLPLRDPEGFLGPAYVRLPMLGLVFIAGGILTQAVIRTKSIRVWGEAKQIVRDEWNWSRLVHVAIGLISFYVCYVSYRNLKGFLPFVREDVLYDTDLMRLDKALLFGHYPANILHDLLGTGVAAEVLSFFYVFYLVLVPVSLAALLVWSRDITLGAWYATALSLNWLLGVVSYYALPTLGPAFPFPQFYSELPQTGAVELQNSLFHAAERVYSDPQGSSSIYGIAGFASLHVSVVVSACLFLQWTGAIRIIRYSAWTFLGIVVVATLYFGWHYIADDIAGAFIGWLAVVIGAWVTGNRRHRHRLDEPEPSV